MAPMSRDVAGGRGRLRQAPYRPLDTQNTEELTRMSFNVQLVLGAYGNSTRVQTPVPMISAAAAVECLSPAV